MKTLEENSKSVNLGKMVLKTTINEDLKHPYLENKLQKANRLLKKVGLPKELVS